MNKLTDEKIINYIDEKITANKDHVSKFGSCKYYDGAIDALQEIAVELGIVQNYDYFN